MIRIGISGWTYSPWRGTFYPKNLTIKRQLEFASRQVNSIEINGSFYSLQRPKTYGVWFAATPDDFVFSVKANRFITHVRRLRDIDRPLGNFFASGILGLRQKLGPVLWQFPPDMRFDPPLFEDFLASLPSNTEEASRIAERHDTWMHGRALIDADSKRPLRHAVEVRNSSFQSPEFAALLRRYRVALVFSDSGGHWPYFEDITSDFVYARLHGPEELYSSGYDSKALDEWARRVRLWTSGRQRMEAPLCAPRVRPLRRTRDAYVYFDNDAKVHAPFDAMELLDRLTDFRPARAPRRPVVRLPGRRRA